MVKKIVKSGEEYELKKQKSKAKKIAWIFSILWVIFAVFPITTYFYRNSIAIKNFVVVSGVYEANKVLMEQYNDLSNSLSKKINISKYTSKIAVAEIKLDKVSNKTEKVAKTANLLSKIGVKGADKVADTSEALQKQVDKVNKEIKEKTSEVSKNLERDLDKTLKDELKSFGQNQMQKQLNLSDTNYKNLTAGNYGIMTEEARKISASIYAELSKTKIGIVRNLMKQINTYYNWISLFVILLIIAIGLVPVFVALKIAKFLSTTFTTCPYCGKMFISKKAKLKLLTLIKFW